MTRGGGPCSGRALPCSVVVEAQGLVTTAAVTNDTKCLNASSCAADAELNVQMEPACKRQGTCRRADQDIHFVRPDDE